MKFSPYTQITKCADVNDIKAGIAELTAYFKKCREAGKLPSKKATLRMNRLMKRVNANIVESIASPKQEFDIMHYVGKKVVYSGFENPWMNLITSITDKRVNMDNGIKFTSSTGRTSSKHYLGVERFKEYILSGKLVLIVE